MWFVWVELNTLEWSEAEGHLMLIYQGSEVSSSHDRNPILSSRPEHLMPNNVLQKLLLQLQIEAFCFCQDLPNARSFSCRINYGLHYLDIDHEILIQILTHTALFERNPYLYYSIPLRHTLFQGNYRSNIVTPFMYLSWSLLFYFRSTFSQ